MGGSFGREGGDIWLAVTAEEYTNGRDWIQIGNSSSHYVGKSHTGGQSGYPNWGNTDTDSAHKRKYCVVKELVKKYPNDMELGEKVRQLYWLQQENFFKEDDRSWIYESPDGGKTVTRRKMGADVSTRETLTDSQQLELFK